MMCSVFSIGKKRSRINVVADGAGLAAGPKGSSPIGPVVCAVDGVAVSTQV